MSNEYVTLRDLKTTLELTTAHADRDLQTSIAAASVTIEGCCRRRFWKDADANQVRRFTPLSPTFVWTFDIANLTSVKVDDADDGTYSTTLTEGTDFVLEPLNAAADAEPWTELVAKRRAWVVRSAYVQVTARFGWPEVPQPIVEATRILAVKLFKRKREAPFGVVTWGSETGALMRLAREDPDVGPLIRDYVRPQPPV